MTDTATHSTWGLWVTQEFRERLNAFAKAHGITPGRLATALLSDAMDAGENDWEGFLRTYPSLSSKTVLMTQNK